MRSKRVFDVVLAAIVLVPLAPVLAVVALAVRVLSGRPVLHRAVRSGRDGVPFVMYKFRTMRVGDAGAAVTGRQDERLTGIGRMLRRLRVDETPQILNVLRGDMSFVGPRPEDPRFVATYTPEQREVLRVRPGITSPAAVAYRNEADLLPTDPSLRDAFYVERLLAPKLALDLDYVRRRSLVGDLRIIAATAAAVLGATSPPPPTDRAEQPPHADLVGRRVVVVLGALDGFANGVRARAVLRYLQERGHDVRLVDTDRLSRLSTERASWRSRLPAPSPAKALLYCVELAGSAVRRSSTWRGRLSYLQLVAELELRRRVLASTVDLHGVDLVIAETPHDSSYVASVTGSGTRTLYDCPTPWADELWYEGRLSERQHAKMRGRERAVMEAVDHLAFHWHSYADYARHEYDLADGNILRLDWGCDPPAQRASVVEPPRLVYLGSLGSRFIDLPLLARLCRRYPHVDVYGGPEPDPGLGLPYRGYATSEVLGRYQFGLITCTDDPLRREGFSAKHLDYLSAGLPVLAPEWRRSAAELGGTLLYDEPSFLEVIGANSSPARWTALSEAARRQASALTWDRTLGGLDDVLTTSRRAVPRQRPAPGSRESTRRSSTRGSEVTTASGRGGGTR